MVRFSLSDEHFELAVNVYIWSWHVLSDCLKKVRDAFTGSIERIDSPSFFGSGIDRGILELVIRSIKIAK